MPGGTEVATIDIEVDACVLAALVSHGECFGLAPISRLGGAVSPPVRAEIGGALDRRRLAASLPRVSRSSHALIVPSARQPPGRSGRPAGRNVPRRAVDSTEGE